MFVASEDRAVFRFSTRDVPLGSRVSIYRDLFEGQAVGFGIDALDVEFSCDVASRTLSGLRVNRIASTPAKVAWRGATGSEEILSLILFQHGKGIVSHCGREATVGAGSAIVLSSADPLSMLRTRSRYAYLSLPRKTLASMISNVDAEIMSVVPAETEALRHLAGYLDLLTRDTVVMSPELTGIATTHVQDLVALALGATSDAAAVANGRGLRAARLRAIRADIMSNLGSGEVRAAPPRRAPRRDAALYSEVVRERGHHIVAVCAAPSPRQCTPHAHRSPPCRFKHRRPRLQCRLRRPFDLQPRIPALLWRDSLRRPVCCKRDYR